MTLRVLSNISFLNAICYKVLLSLVLVIFLFKFYNKLIHLTLEYQQFELMFKICTVLM